jgi:hypothetical protein
MIFSERFFTCVSFLAEVFSSHGAGRGRRQAGGWRLPMVRVERPERLASMRIVHSINYQRLRFNIFFSPRRFPGENVKKTASLQ